MLSVVDFGKIFGSTCNAIDIQTWGWELYRPKTITLFWNRMNRSVPTGIGSVVRTL